MSTKSNPKVEDEYEKYNDEDEEAKKKKKKPKKKFELFPPLQKRPQAPKIMIQIENSCIFPKVGPVGNSDQITFIGHAKPVIKIIFIKTPQYPNHLCSLSLDGKIKLWKLKDTINSNSKCVKCIETNEETLDIMLGKNNNIIVCGEGILMINLETEEKIVIQEKKFYRYVDFNLLGRINENVGVCTSLNDYYLIFDLNKGNIIKRIEFDKTHFICMMEKNQKIKKNKAEKKVEGPGKENEKEEEGKEKASINIDINSSGKEKEKEKEKIKNEIQKIIRDLGSGKCKEFEGGHKGHVHALLGINTEKIKDSIISGGEDNVIKIININKPREIIDLIGHDNTIECLAMGKSKEYLYSGSLDYTIKKWDLIKKECIMTMGFNNAFQILLLPMDNDYLLSVGINSKIKLWNENCLNVKSYRYTHGYVRSGVIVSYNKDFDKTTFVFGDDKGNIFMKQFLIGEENINKNKEHFLKIRKESSEKITRNKFYNNSFRKNQQKQSPVKTEDNYFNFKESTYQTENTEN